MSVWRSRRSKVVAGVVILVLALGLLFGWPVWALEVVEPDSGQVLWRERVEKGKQFTVAWTHSVSKQEVEETYRVADSGELELEEMVFDEPGPNLPAFPEGETQWDIGEGRFVVTDYDLVLQEVPVQIGAWIADHHLWLGEQRVSLQKVHEPGEEVRLRVRTYTLGGHLVEEVRLWRKTR